MSEIVPGAKPTIIDAFAAHEAEQNRKDPDRPARIAALRQAQQDERRAKREAIIARYGSEEAALAGPRMQQALVAAAGPHTTRAPYEFMNGAFDADHICGWNGSLFEKLNAEARAVLAQAWPMPATLAEARDEYDLWNERDAEMDLLLCHDGFAADSYLPLACRGRKQIMEGLLDGGLPATTVDEALSRLRWIIEAGELSTPAGDALVRDLERLTSVDDPAPVAVPIYGEDGALIDMGGEPEPHPDQALLDVCVRLQAQQAEWQRLWDATPEDDREATPEDETWDRYSRDVWPAGPLFGQLLHLRATTPEGMQAKGAAILAADEAGNYLDVDHSDFYQINRSLLEDVAGSARQLVGFGT